MNGCIIGRVGQCRSRKLSAATTTAATATLGFRERHDYTPFVLTFFAGRGMGWDGSGNGGRGLFLSIGA